MKLLRRTFELAVIYIDDKELKNKNVKAILIDVAHDTTMPQLFHIGKKHIEEMVEVSPAILFMLFSNLFSSTGRDRKYTLDTINDYLEWIAK